MLYTVKQVAAILHTNVDYVHKLRKSGVLPFLKIGSYKVRAEALDEFLKKYEGMDLTDPSNVKPLGGANGAIISPSISRDTAHTGI